MMSTTAVQTADISEQLAAQVREASEQSSPLRIVGGDSKSNLGRQVSGEAVSVTGHCGVIEYAASELVITARAGTPLREVEAVLAAEGQMLPFEPPYLGDAATLGGTIACGLSGPRRPYAGAARDLMLGVKMINGQGEILNFGGQVMKNVAGYDLTRLQAGAQGTLGVLLDISLKVLPRPVCEKTTVLEMSADQAVASMNTLAGNPLPLSAAAHVDGRLYLRLSGAESAVNSALQRIGGEVVPQDDTFWSDLRERRLPFFSAERALWRLSVPAAGPVGDVPGECLLDWGGAQRWLKTAAPAEVVRQFAAELGGHATLLSTSGAEFEPLSTGVAALHRRLKQAFDPRGILNPGRLYEEF